MAVAVTVTNIPELITLADGTEHTVTINTNLYGPGIYTVYVTVVAADSTLKLNAQGDASDSSATYATGDKEFITLSGLANKLRINGTTGDTIRISV